jgi:Winged helix DNA-binding domain
VPIETLSLRALNRATLARQLLLARDRVPVVEALERLGGLQAQEPKPAFAALWSRLEGFARDDLGAALREREVVRGTLMRGTLHLVSAGDFCAFRSALQPVLDQGLRALGDRAEGLDVAAVLAVARTLLARGPRTFTELRAGLLEAFPDVNERALGFAVRMRLPLVVVPTDDPWSFRSPSQFTLAETWLGEGLVEQGSSEALVRRHLAAFGPATTADIQSWSGLKGLGAVVDGLRPELSVFRDARGRELFDLPGAPRPNEDVDAPTRLLPEFDSLLLAHADRTRIVADEHRSGLVTKNLRVRATFLVDGTISGTWTVERARKAATLVLAPFSSLPKRVVKPLVEESSELLRFLEADATTFDVRVS